MYLLIDGFPIQHKSNFVAVDDKAGPLKKSQNSNPRRKKLFWLFFYVSKAAHKVETEACDQLPLILNITFSFLRSNWESYSI